MLVFAVFCAFLVLKRLLFTVYSVFWLMPPTAPMFRHWVGQQFQARDFSSALTYRCWVSVVPSSLSSRMSSLEKDMCQRHKLSRRDFWKKPTILKYKNVVIYSILNFENRKIVRRGRGGGECSWRRSRATRIPSKELSPSRVKDFWCFSGPASEDRRLGARLTIELSITIEGLRQGHWLRRVGRRPDFI